MEFVEHERKPRWRNLSDSISDEEEGLQEITDVHTAASCKGKHRLTANEFSKLMTTPRGDRNARCVLRRHGSELNRYYTFQLLTTPTAQRSDKDWTLYAKHRLGTSHSMYVVSGNVDDLRKSRTERSEWFLGKLEIHWSRKVYVGIEQDRNEGDDRLRREIAVVVYDHERSSATDRKMEVALPLCAHDERIKLMSTYMEIRREGAQNHLHAEKVLVLREQGDCKGARVSSPSGLVLFAGVATAVSTKNFSLIRSTPGRASAMGLTTTTTTATATAMTTSSSSGGDGGAGDYDDYHDDVPVTPRRHRNAEHGDERKGIGNNSCDNNVIDVNGDGDGDETFMRFGRLTHKSFACSFEGPVSFLSAFMIALSRLDTLQKF